MYPGVCVQRTENRHVCRAHAYSGLGCITELNIECCTGFIAAGRPLLYSICTPYCTACRSGFVVAAPVALRKILTFLYGAETQLLGLLLHYRHHQRSLYS